MATAGFNGLTVAAFESRMAAEITRLIEHHGGNPLITPALREIPLDDNSAALKFGDQLTTEQVDMLILLTGVGTTALFNLIKTRYPWSSIVAALEQTALVARGPKPVAALKAFGLQPTLTVPEPNTWVDLVSTLDEYRQFTRVIKVPVLANLTEFGKTPLFTTDELAKAGIQLALYPLSAYRAMAAAAEHVYRTLREKGTQRSVVDTMQTREQLYEVLGYHEYEAKLDELFAKKGKTKKSPRD